jgi:hypothetical protein
MVICSIPGAIEGRDARVAGLGDEYERVERECESRGRGKWSTRELAKKKNESERILAFFLSRRRALLPQFLPPWGLTRANKVKNVECPIRRESLQHCEE